ncbi:TPA: DEAD/DEAH box helicase [Candidatus Poribacteria bacterium]|nr:DEAD/DEAH box helicase [Candidatus Poribacteria bacterium]
MTDVAQIMAIRNRLKRAWSPFFTRFGRLTPVQVETIPRILDGANIVVASPTASGKTEAVVAPLAERFILDQWEGLAVLYVVPTRALANDTFARIEGPLRDMNIMTALKHGDKPLLPKVLPNFLITTPESLDSLICRKPQVFAKLHAVILDEIHLLDNTYRGDQLRILLWRLRDLALCGNFSTYLMSATLSDPHQIARRYINEFEIVTVPGRREIDHHFIDSYKESYQLARTQGWNKLLCFCNLRESVEAVANDLAQLWHPYPVFAHHGSLSRQVREEVEKAMKEKGVGVCVATSTLEVGIDIGDIDLIVLVDPPWSVSSLMQRIGRGNRREGLIHTAAVVTSSEERSIIEAMFETAISGKLPVESYKPDISVAVQQIFSYLYQHTEGVPETELVRLVSPLCLEEDLGLILKYLRKCGWIEWRAGFWFASARLMDMGEEGRIHSNIPDSQSYKVVDVNSGREIGTIAGTFDEIFILARTAWQVISVGNNVIRAQHFKGKASAPLFQRHRNIGAFYSLLPLELRG